MPDDLQNALFFSELLPNSLLHPSKEIAATTAQLSIPWAAYGCRVRTQTSASQSLKLVPSSSGMKRKKKP